MLTDAEMAARRLEAIRRLQWQPIPAAQPVRTITSSDHEVIEDRYLMPVLLQEARDIAKASGDIPTLALYGAFLTTYALVWTKTRIKANREDLRTLIGAEILLQRA